MHISKKLLLRAKRNLTEFESVRFISTWKMIPYKLWNQSLKIVAFHKVTPSYDKSLTILSYPLKVKLFSLHAGTLIRRHRIPLPAPDNDQFYNLHHFNINQEMVFYSRTFMITDCDPFTHNFLRKMGVRLKAPSATPTDPYTELRQEVSMWLCS